MANKIISNLDQLSDPQGTDILPITDVDDPTGSSAGTTKRVSLANVINLANVGNLRASNNLSDLSNVSSSRTNLGLGTASTSASTDFSPAFKTLVSKTANFILSDSENGKVVFCNSSGRLDVTIPTGLTSGFNAQIVQGGAGRVRFLSATGVTINGYTSGPDAPNSIIGQHGVVDFVTTGTNTYTISGDIAFFNVFSNNYSVTHDGTNHHCGATIDRLGGASWSTTTPVSQSAWVKSLSFATNDGVFGMGNGGSGGSYNPSFTGGNGGIHQQGGTATSGGYYMWLSGSKYSLSGTFNTGDWHHIAWTWDGSNGVVYVDGNQNITFTDTSNGYTSRFNVYTGVVRWSTNFGECLVDEFATWDTALTASNITTLYNSGNGPADISSLSPLAWYRMGDGTEAGSGTSLYDMSGNNQSNMTLFNGATYASGSGNIP
jgi:hypothetical protein